MELALHPRHLVDRLHHVHRDPDRARLVRDRPGDGLPDPPGRIRGELVALGVVELLHRPDQAEVPLLDQVEEAQPTADVALGDGHHQPQVGLDQPLFRAQPLGREQGQLGPPGAAAGQASGQFLVCEQPGLDRLRELDLVFGREQWHPADLAQVDPHEVAGDRAPGLLGGPGLGAAIGLLRRGVEDVHSFVGEHPGHALDCLGREVAGIESNGDVCHCHGPLLPGTRDQVGHLVPGLPSAGE